eukprot:3144499-Pleurochrysis_carterae.AAC.1
MDDPSAPAYLGGGPLGSDPDAWDACATRINFVLASLSLRLVALDTRADGACLPDTMRLLAQHALIPRHLLPPDPTAAGSPRLCEQPPPHPLA